MSPLETGSVQKIVDGGAGRIRTDDILLAKQALCQLSYDPMMGNFEKNILFEIYFVRSTETQTTRTEF